MNNFDKLKLKIDSKYVQINEKLFEQRISVDGNKSYNIPSSILKNFIGINEVQYNLNETIITISGKVMADKNYLGYINKDNFYLVFEKLNTTGFIHIDNISSDKIQVLSCDVTKDISVENVEKSLFGIYNLLQVLSDKYDIRKKGNCSIWVKPYAKYKKDILSIYYKYEELRSHNNTQYLDIIGYDFLEKSKNTLRIELRLCSFLAIRNAFHLEKGDIYLDNLFSSKCNPIIEKFEELGLTRGYINAI